MFVCHMKLTFSSFLFFFSRFSFFSYAIIPASLPPGKYKSDYALYSNSKRFASQSEQLRRSYEEEWSRESEKRIQAMKGFFTFMFAEKGDKIVAAATAAAAAAAMANTTATVSQPSAIGSSSTSTSTSTSTTHPPISKEKQEKADATQAALNQAFAQFGIEIDSTKDKLPFPLPPLRTDEEREQDRLDIEEYLDEYENALGFAIANVNTREIKIPLTSVQR